MVVHSIYLFLVLLNVKSHLLSSELNLKLALEYDFAIAQFNQSIPSLFVMLMDQLQQISLTA